MASAGADDLLHDNLTNVKRTDEITSQMLHKTKKILATSVYARSRDDYALLDKVVQSIPFFADIDQAERLQYLRASRGVSLNKGQVLFSIGDPADSFYCVLSGALNVVVDLSRVKIHTKRELLNRAKIYSCLNSPGVGTEQSMYTTSYVVRCLRRFDSFGDAGMLALDSSRTATVVAIEDSLLLRIEKEAFLDCRSKLAFLAKIKIFQHWTLEAQTRLCQRLERVLKSYNDVLLAQDADPQFFYLLQLGECRLVKRHTSRESNQPLFIELGSLSSGQCFGAYEILRGMHRGAFSVLVSSPSAVLYRIEKSDVRYLVLKDAITEQLLKADANDLYARMHKQSIEQDLVMNTQWHEYKEAVLAEATPRRHAKLTPHLLPFVHSLDPSPLGPSATMPPKSPAVRGPPKPMVPVRPHVPPAAASEKLFQRHKTWLQWAKNRVANVSLVDDGDAATQLSRKGSTNRTTRIMCGKVKHIKLDDAIHIPGTVHSVFKHLSTVRGSSFRSGT
ncbi:hypothetical protein SPRG_10735 [Saprolegnia parasitica CBS 223.65]|uniref:Cyclic nucleotide-binding domain-containing protein n=1 Tax=Saprolegnia parasitica (strain CBS 223.65) TaxID=695850 RepID=A0A067BZ33_SAPPC|nr:hypothetical protein SPRG_10735 [Saprolegnia parasitica CBS 223.65]KDO23543.1 hypothetical protein SPRG_10735 [Saprolegnia parasitica CBS 223.65]|eukprot:XP_012205693.1 hypothetical protein SPRG_10735 [Saprolegnia parasitica CBS 223.65]